MGESILTNFNVGDIIWHTYYDYYAFVLEVSEANHIRIQPLNNNDLIPFWLGVHWAQKVS
jgi:hypothetical protein